MIHYIHKQSYERTSMFNDNKKLFIAAAIIIGVIAIGIVIAAIATLREDDPATAPASAFPVNRP